MANIQPADLLIRYGGTSLFIRHNHASISISEDQNWTNAAIALFDCMGAWHKNPKGVWWYDAPGVARDSQVRVGRLIMEWEEMELSFDENTTYGYDADQRRVFQKLKDNFDRVKKISAFL